MTRTGAMYLCLAAVAALLALGVSAPLPAPPRRRPVVRLAAPSLQELVQVPELHPNRSAPRRRKGRAKFPTIVWEKTWRF